MLYQQKKLQQNVLMKVPWKGGGETMCNNCVTLWNLLLNNLW